MFGVNKKRQAKSVEEFVGGQDGEALSAAIDAADNQTTAPAPKRWFVAPAVAAGALKSEVAQLELRIKSQSADGLKAQAAALNANVDESQREAAALKGRHSPAGKKPRRDEIDGPTEAKGGDRRKEIGD